MKEVSLLPHTVEEIFGLDTNDPQMIGWEIEKLEVDKQWMKSRGDGVTIGVIDTGCDANHPDIKDNIIGGYNIINNSKNFNDDNGHGSHVCGTICATDNGRGMVGVAPKSKVFVIKALDASGNGKFSQIARGIDLAIQEELDILTMSLGCRAEVPEIKKLLQKARDNNILVFCAAGNSGELSDIMYPASDINTISIGSIDSSLNRTHFTCSGEGLDFLAPGTDIMSILPGNRYGLMSGTSMSNPFAAGCAALYLSYFRSKRDKKYIDQQEMIDLFKKTAINLKNIQYRSKKYQGYGIIKPVL